MSQSQSALERETLAYHEFPRPGKLEVVPSKPVASQHDLSLAYTPGVAIPCMKIQQDPEGAYRWTNRGNLVAVITNGTAVLGLGHIGALAGKPVMEGKGVLFKKFAGIDVFDIEVEETDPEAFIETVRRIAPTFGGINLEDIRSPECFEIERRLKADLDIPVFHDDQHGTAIIASAALMNAAELAGKHLADLEIVVSGAGAAGIACIEMFVEVGVDPAKVIFVDREGVVHTGRDDLNPEKQRIAVDTDARTLAEAMRGKDLFLGVSVGGVVDQDMVRSMAERPIVMAMANPDPEISYPDAIAARDDVIMLTGRSDYPNQVNNVLCFPFIFRGALDVRATAITPAMKIACARALAELAREDVPETVMDAYGGHDLRFGPTYLIPKPFDQRVLLWVAPAVAEAAVMDGVARVEDFDKEAYRLSLERYLGGARQVMAAVHDRARRAEATVAFAEGAEPRALRAAHQMLEQELARPVLIGDRAQVEQKADELGVDLAGMRVVDPRDDTQRDRLAKRLYDLRCRRGVNRQEATNLARNARRYALLMVEADIVDCAVTGVNRSYPDSVRDAFQIIGTRDGKRAAAVHLMVLKDDRTLFLADTSLHIEPTARELADTAIVTADLARAFDYTPRVAMLSFSNFGSVPDPAARKVREAVQLVTRERPDIVIDGEMHADVALDRVHGNRQVPHSRIAGDANVLIFPDLASGNIGYKLLEHLAGAESIGPILVGMRKPVVVGYQAARVQTLVNLTTVALARMEAQAPLFSQ